MTSSTNLWKKVDNFLSAAMFWITLGFDVIPVLSGTKKPAVKWDLWLDGLSPQKVHEHWTEHPDHEVGCILGDDMIVLDADSPESVSALAEIEDRFGLKPKLVVKTAKGVHHYFRRAPSTIAKSDSHDSVKLPDRVDIKTGRALVILPNSTGKSINILETEDKNELSEASQQFIDAIYQHNGKSAPSQPLKLKAYNQSNVKEISIPKIESLLCKIDPDCSYDDWLRVGMALFHETKGSDDGLALYDRWSSSGSKYKGKPDIETKWKSFSLNEPQPVTIATLVMMANNAEGPEQKESNQDDAARVVKDLIEKAKEDCGAPLEPESVAALAEIKKSDPAEFARIRKELKKANREISLTAMDSAIKSEPVEGDIQETHHGYAGDLITNKLTCENWAPVGHQGSLYVLDSDNNIWIRKTPEALIKLVAENYDGNDNCKRIADYRGIAEHSIMLATDHDFFIDAPVGLACPDGFYQIKENEIKVASLSPAHRQRVKIDVTPKEEETPLFDKFLHETFQSSVKGEEEQQLTLVQEVIGAIMLGLMARHQKAVLFYDPFGRAGKGTLERIIRKLVPFSFITAVNPFKWDNEYYLAILIGARLNSVGELPDSKPIPAAAFKTVTGGDLLTGRHPSGRPFTFINEAAHLFMSNHLINTQDHSEAFFTRWLIVEFPNSRLLKELPIDPELPQRIIKDELPGIAFWALKGGKRLMKNGSFSESIVHYRLMEKWRHSTNSLHEFINECCDLSTNEYELRSKFYSEYKKWCDENGRKPFAKGKVKDMLAANIQLEITHTVLDGYEIFRGVKIKKEDFRGLNTELRKT